ncbi:hypothetical protein PTT_09288, partial [Pyrenophora teres f. teres 0-1]
MAAQAADRPGGREWLRSTYLSAEDTDTGSGLRVGDFINYTRYTEARTAWFTNEMVDWSLEAAMQACGIKGSTNTAVASLDTSRYLYAVAIGRYPLTEGETLQQSLRSVVEAFNGRRWVFLPVCNGFALELGAIERHNQNLKSGEKNGCGKAGSKQAGGKKAGGKKAGGKKPDDIRIFKKPKATKPATAVRVENDSVEEGSHWSFIVIDTQDQTARYIDGMVRATRLGQNRYRIRGTEINGTVAGKILCGFDTLMGREKGALRVSTLKWTPNQFENNANNGDAGACGPHVFALMTFIIGRENREILEHGVKRYFRETAFEANCKRVGFDSARSRREIQRIIRGVRERKEDAAAATGNPLYSMNLSPQRMVRVLVPDVLRECMKGRVLEKLMRFHERHEENFSNESSGESEKIREEFLKQLQGEDSAKQVEAFKKFMPGLKDEQYNGLIKDFLDQMKARPQDIEWHKRQHWALGNFPGYREQSSLKAFRELFWKENQDLRAAYNIAHGLEPDDPGPEDEEGTVGPAKPQPPKRVAERNHIIVPEAIAPEDTPNDFADVEAVDEATLKLWVNANHETLDNIFVRSKRHLANHVSRRAALQAISGQTFLEEDLTRVDEIWRNDSYVFDKKNMLDRLTGRLLLYRTYERPHDTPGAPPGAPSGGPPGAPSGGPPGAPP